MITDKYTHKEGIVYLYQKKQYNTSLKTKTTYKVVTVMAKRTNKVKGELKLNFVLNLKLDTELYQEDILDKRLDIGRSIYNAC